MGLRNCLFLASSVRSGSTFIAEEIAYRFERMAGWQFFDLTRDAFASIGDRSTADDVRAIYNKLYLDSSGWACSKIHCAGLSVIVRETRNDEELRNAFFGPRARWIIVRRRDRIAQAVSLAVARRTGVWHTYSEGEVRPIEAKDVAPKEVEDALRAIAIDDAYLDAFSRQMPEERRISVVYEDVVESARRTAKAVLDLCALGVTLPRERGGRVAKLVRSDQDLKRVIAENFVEWFARNYCEVAMGASAQSA